MLPVNSLGTAWFKEVDVKINGTIVSFDGGMYAHRADTENRLSYPETVKNVHLSMMGFDEEDVPFDDINNDDIHWVDANEEHTHQAILRRYLKGKASKKIYTIARIRSEIFEQPKLLPFNTVLDIEFYRNNPQFLLLTKHNDRAYQIIMDNCELLTRIVEMDGEITAKINSVSIAGRSMSTCALRKEICYPGEYLLQCSEKRQCMVIMEEIHSIINISILKNFASKFVYQKSHFLL